MQVLREYMVPGMIEPNWKQSQHADFFYFESLVLLLV